MTEHRRRSEAGFYRPQQEAQRAAAETETQAQTQAAELDAMTRPELLERAQQMGLDVNARTAKDDLRKAIEEASQ